MVVLAWLPRRLRPLAALALITPLGCSSNGAGPQRSVTSIQVSGSPVLYGEPGEIEAYTATATWSDGSTSDQTLTATWTSSDASVAETLSSGHVESVAAGVTTIAAAANGVSGSLSIQVAPPNWQFVGAPTLTQVDTQTEFLAVDPRDERTLYVGTLQGLYVTHDGGGSWTMPVTGPNFGIAIDPVTPDTVYAIANTHALMRSVDRGDNFATVQVFDDVLRSIRISVATPGTIFLGVEASQASTLSGVFRSTDLGRTWQRFPFGASGALIPWSIAEDATDGTLYSGTEITPHPLPYHPPFFRSTDRGQTWVDVAGTLPWHVIHTAVNPVTHQVYALTEGANGLYQSMDHAATWSRLDQSFGLSLLLDPRNLTHVFGADFATDTKRGGAYISTRSGAQFVPYGLEGRDPLDLALNGTSTNLYAACIGSGIYVTNVPPGTKAAP